VSTVGADVASLDLVGTDGVGRSLSGQRGRPVLVVFFKSTCGACRLTFPYLQRLHEAYSGRGLAVWGVSQDTLDDTLVFAADAGVTFPMLLDPPWAVSTAYGLDMVPALFLYDGAGKVVFSSAGFSKSALNELARLAAQYVGAEAVTVAPDGDGKPPYRPG
jgi:peroxiredoxin